MKDLRIESIEIDRLVPYENNPRIIDNAIPLVAESIRQCGYVTPIVVDEDMVILAGHTRFEALKSLGITECEIIIASGLTEEQKKKYRLLDNKTGEVATWDRQKLIEELQDIDFEGFDFGQIVIDTSGFDEIEIDDDKNVVICPRCKSEVEA